MSNWTALQILNQAAGELGLTQPASIVGTDVQSSQLLALLNAAGNELLMYYPWQQFAKPFTISLVNTQETYALPTDYAYFRDQTQWDKVNRWPLLGPKSAQEWAWLQNSQVATLPRMRYRIQGDLIKVYPIPTSNVTDAFSMEYISNYWARATASANPDKSLITLDSDVVHYDPWLAVKFVKFKFYELKGFATAGVRADFQRVFDSLTGKDTGAQILSLSPSSQTSFIGAGSIPDGSWVV